MAEETDVTDTPSMTNKVTDVSESAISNSFKGILRVSSDSSGIGGELLTVCSSDGTATPLGLSNSGVSVDGSLTVTDITAKNVTADNVSINDDGALQLGNAGLTVIGPFTADGTFTANEDSTFFGPVTIGTTGSLVNNGNTILSTTTFNGITTFSQRATFKENAAFSNGITVNTGATFYNNCPVKIGGGVTIHTGALTCNASATFNKGAKASSITTSVINSTNNSLTLNASTFTKTPLLSETNNSRIVTIGYINSRLNNLPNQMPVGSILMWGSVAEKVPAGWCICDGRALSRTTYKDLFNVIYTTYGRGNGSTTFNIPDFRGVFPRGLDNGRGIDSGRTLGTRQWCGAPNITGRGHADINRGQTDNVSGAFYNGAATRIWHWPDGVYEANYLEFNASRVSSVYQNNLTEVRPTNLSVNFIIKIQNVGELPYDVAVKYKTNHASASTEFGVANGTNYGHVRLTDSITKSDNRGVGSGFAVTPKALSQGSVLVDSGRSGANWWRKYSDGWIEQGGRVAVRHRTESTITFHTAFSDTNYSPQFTVERYSSTAVGYTDDISITISALTNKNITVYSFDGGDNYYTTYIRWKACGY